ncbi:hypothetical protein [Clostridium sp. JN-9]|mgnify:CR=1 FL=1|nr:hypothetical protein [Clostridium sp. JN-9]
MKNNIYELVELILKLWENGMSLQKAIDMVKEENIKRIDKNGY